MKTMGKVAVVPVIASGLVAATATAAAAAPAGGAARQGSARCFFEGYVSGYAKYLVNGARIRSNADLDATVGGLGYKDQTAYASGWESGLRGSGYLWIFNEDLNTGIVGYTAHSLIRASNSDLIELC
jgi:hypothetical protein